MRKIIIFIAGILFVFYLGCEKENVVNSNPTEELPVLGTWMWGSVLSTEGSDAVVQKLYNNNVNSVFLLVKGISGSKTSPDILKSFIYKAHEKNIKVHFWYVVSSDGVFVDSHPDAHIYHCPKPSLGFNKAYPMDDERINLLYPGYKEYVIDNLKYFIENFNCDGIHLDYIRYSHFVYSFDKQHLIKAASLGCDTTRILNFFVDNYDHYAYDAGFVDLFAQGDEDVVKWVNLRKNIVYSYIYDIRELLKKINPELVLSASFMPEGAYEPEWADSYYSQNYELNSELLDFIAPMSYFKDYGEGTEWIKYVTENAINQVQGKCNICSGIQSYDNISSQQLREQIIYAKEAKADGVIFFRYGDTSVEQWEVIKELFGQWAEL